MLIMTSKLPRPPMQTELGISRTTTTKYKQSGIIIAAIINAAAIVFAALITSFFTYLNVAASRERTSRSDVVSWQQTARANGWIPKTECEWRPTIAFGRDPNG